MDYWRKVNIGGETPTDSLSPWWHGPAIAVLPLADGRIARISWGPTSSVDHPEDYLPDQQIFPGSSMYVTMFLPNGTILDPRVIWYQGPAGPLDRSAYGEPASMARIREDAFVVATVAGYTFAVVLNEDDEIEVTDTRIAEVWRNWPAEARPDTSESSSTYHYVYSHVGGDRVVTGNALIVESDAATKKVFTRTLNLNAANQIVVGSGHELDGQLERIVEDGGTDGLFYRYCIRRISTLAVGKDYALVFWDYLLDIRYDQFGNYTRVYETLLTGGGSTYPLDQIPSWLEYPPPPGDWEEYEEQYGAGWIAEVPELKMEILDARTGNALHIVSNKFQFADHSQRWWIPRVAGFDAIAPPRSLNANFREPPTISLTGEDNGEWRLGRPERKGDARLPTLVDDNTFAGWWAGTDRPSPGTGSNHPGDPYEPTVIRTRLVKISLTATTVTLDQSVELDDYPIPINPSSSTTWDELFYSPFPVFTTEGQAIYHQGVSADGADYQLVFDAAPFGARDLTPAPLGEFNRLTDRVWGVVGSSGRGWTVGVERYDWTAWPTVIRVVPLYRIIPNIVGALKEKRATFITA